MKNQENQRVSKQKSNQLANGKDGKSNMEKCIYIYIDMCINKYIYIYKNIHIESIKMESNAPKITTRSQAHCSKSINYHKTHKQSKSSDSQKHIQQNGYAGHEHPPTTSKTEDEEKVYSVKIEKQISTLQRIEIKGIKGGNAGIENRHLDSKN